MKKLIIAFLFLSFSTQGFAQFFKDSKTVIKHEGYVTFYYDESTDKIFLQIENLHQEFLYVNSLSEGIGSNDIGLDRGQLGNTRIVKFMKAGNKLLLIQPNQDYRAITDNLEEKKSVEQAFAKSVIHGFVIKDLSKQFLKPWPHPNTVVGHIGIEFAGAKIEHIEAHGILFFDGRQAEGFFRRQQMFVTGFRVATKNH